MKSRSTSACVLSLFKEVMHAGQCAVELYQDTYLWGNENVKAFLKGTDIAEPVFDRDSLRCYLVRSIGLDEQYLGQKVTQ